jgi:hypothetical protein
MVQVHPRSAARKQAELERTHAAMRTETAALSQTQLPASDDGNLH